MIFVQIFPTKEETYPNRVGDQLSKKICQKGQFTQVNEVSKEVQ